jgi:hypothetical protein
MIWSPASSCEEEENAKKFFNIKNNNISQTNDLSAAFVNPRSTHSNSPTSLSVNLQHSIDRNLISRISSPSLNHLGQISELSFNKASQQPQTTSSSSSPLPSHLAISHHCLEESGTKKGRIFKVKF